MAASEHEGRDRTDRRPRGAPDSVFESDLVSRENHLYAFYPRVDVEGVEPGSGWIITDAVTVATR